MRFDARPCFFSLVSRRLAAFIAAVLDDLIENISILVDSPPQPMFLAGDGDEDFVQVPNIIGAGPLPAQSANVLGAELLPPTADRFLGDDDSALQQHFLDQAQAQREPVI